MTLTPIYLDFQDAFVPQPLPVTLPKTDIEQEALEEAVISSPQYYLLIYYPKTNNLIGSLPTQPIKINLPVHPAIRNKVRLLLMPSVGYGMNSCYKVEYWQWTKPYLPTLMQQTTPSKISKVKLKEEYWLVPAIDGTRLLNYRQFINFQPKFDSKNTNTISLVRGAATDSLLSNLDVVVINSITQNNVTFSGYTIVDDSLVWKEPVPLDPTAPVPTTPAAPTVAIDWSAATTQPLAGSTYQVTYPKPATPIDLLYRDEKVGDLLLPQIPGYTLNGNYPTSNQLFLI